MHQSSCLTTDARPGPPSRPGATLLVVDDDALNRDMLRRRFEHQGYRVLMAASGAEALSMVAAYPCDLVLLDVMMPGLSGLDTLAALRANPATERLPVIMVTARTDSHDIAEALHLGANDYVTKPVDFLVALARTRAQLVRTDAEQAALAVQRQHDLLHAQKLNVVGQLAAGVAHDFNNLLTAIGGYSQFLREDLPEDDQRRDFVLGILRAVDSAALLTRQLLATSRRDTARPEAVDLGAVVTQMVQLLRRVIGERIELVVRLADDLPPVRGNAGHLDQVVMNLMVNACDAMPHGGVLTLQVETVAEQPWVALTVSDTGCGMDEATVARIFQPFFTTKAPGEGTGLGLAVVRGIVEQGGGEIAVTSVPDQGSSFRVWLPRADTDRDVPVADVERPETLAVLGTALVVDDDPEVARVVAEMLARVGFATVVATSAEQALTVSANLTRPLDVLITDVRLPGLGGRELADVLGRSRGSLPVVFMSGHDLAQRDDVARTGWPLLDKPFAAPALFDAIRQASSRRDPAAPPAGPGPG